MKTIRTKLGSFFKSFYYAFCGLKHAFCFERNFRAHVVAAAYVFGFAPHFINGRAEWAILFLTVAFVMAAELFNSSIENITDLACKEKNPIARVVKDVAAGAVLLSALGALFIGIAFFGKPKIWGSLIKYWIGHPYIIVLLALSLVLSFVLVFVFGKEKGGKDI